MPIVMFFIFIAVVGVFTLALGYVLSTVEEPTVSRRCRVSYETRRRRNVRKQRIECRFEG